MGRKSVSLRAQKYKINHLILYYVMPPSPGLPGVGMRRDASKNGLNDVSQCFCH